MGKVLNPRQSLNLKLSQSYITSKYPQDQPKKLLSKQSEMQIHNAQQIMYAAIHFGVSSQWNINIEQITYITRIISNILQYHLSDHVLSRMEAVS